MKTKDEFIKFLKSHRMYSAFVRNLTYTSIDRHFNYATPLVYIASAFTWKLTPEGVDKWYKLDQGWSKVCDQDSK